MYTAILQEYDDTEKLVDDLLALLFAGHETSSHTLTSATYFSVKFPEKFEPVKEELTGLLKRKSLKEVSLSDLNELESFGYFLKECFRLDPAAPGTLLYLTTKGTVIKGV